MASKNALQLRTGPYTDPCMKSLTFNITLTEPWWHRLLLGHQQLIWDGPVKRDGNYCFLKVCTCHRAWWLVA